MASYAAEVLRKLLDAGEWSERLPGERPLAERIGVSRPTLHRALRLLEREGRVAWRRNAPWAIIGKGTPVSNSRRIIFLSPFKLEELDAFSLHQYALLSRYVGERGYTLEIATLPSVVDGGSHKSLEALHRQLNPSCYLLLRCSTQTQTWFSSHRIPVVVMGSAPHNLPLRSVDVDYRAVGRHAISTLRRLGHLGNKVLYLGPEERLIGNVEAEAGLLEGAEGRQQPTLGHLPTKTEDIPDALDAQLSKQAYTALIVMRPAQAITIMGHLARKGIKIPQDLSLLILDENTGLQHMLPRPARYAKNVTRFSTLLRRAVDATLEDSGQTRAESRIVPELIAGDTLGGPK